MHFLALSPPHVIPGNLHIKQLPLPFPSAALPFLGNVHVVNLGNTVDVKWDLSLIRKHRPS